MIRLMNRIKYNLRLLVEECSCFVMPYYLGNKNQGLSDYATTRSDCFSVAQCSLLPVIRPTISRHLAVATDPIHKIILKGAIKLMFLQMSILLIQLTIQMLWYKAYRVPLTETCQFLWHLHLFLSSARTKSGDAAREPW